MEDLADLVDQAFEKGCFTEEERLEALRLDGLVRGKLKESREEVFLAAEVSLTVDIEDVERAQRRARILQRLMDGRVLPVGIGDMVTERARRKAEELGVIVA